VKRSETAAVSPKHRIIKIALKLFQLCRAEGRRDGNGKAGVTGKGWGLGVSCCFQATAEMPLKNS